MKTVPQRIHTNPAQMSDAKNFLGFPGISSNHFSLVNSAFNFQNLLDVVVEITPDSSIIDLRKLASNFDKHNFISAEFNTDLLSFGFWLKKRNYIYFTSTLHNEFRFSYPGDFFKFVAEGNGGNNLNETFDFSFGVDFLQYADAGIGFSRKLLKDKLTVGARYRLLKGINVIHTEKSELLMQTNPQSFDITVSSNIHIKTATSLKELSNIENIGSLDSLKGLDLSVLKNTTNMGSALDFGVMYEVNRKFQISASVNNLGFIKWDNQTQNFKSKNPGASYTYTGVKLEDYINSNQNFDSTLQRLGDTLVDRFQLEQNHDGFKSPLFAEIYLGAHYYLNRTNHAGLLFYTGIYNRKLNPSVTASFNSRLTGLLGLSLSYTVLKNSYFNPGVGFSIDGGPFQLYFVSDNIGGIFYPADVKNVNFRFGFNLAMKRKEMAKKDADAWRLKKEEEDKSEKLKTKS